MNTVNGKGYLILTFNYGFATEKDGKKKYLPVRLSTGIVIDPNYWVAGWFSPSYSKFHKKEFASHVTKIESMKEKLLTAFDDLVKENGDVLPTPDEIISHYKGEGNKKKSKSAVLLADYIRQYIEKDLTHERTIKKFRSVLSMVEAFEAVRKANKLAKWKPKGTGALYLHNFSKDDWNDISIMIDHATCEIPRTFRNHGVDALMFAEKGTAYSQVTKAKYQSDLVTVFNHAREYVANIDIDFKRMDRASKESETKEYLKLDELKALIESRHLATGEFVELHPGEEQARKLFVLGCFAGLRYSDYQNVLSQKIQFIKGDDITFPAIYYVSNKSQTPVCLPLLQPALDILQEHQREPLSVPSNVQINNHLKTICARLGIDRDQNVIRNTADGRTQQTTIPISDLCCTHTGRRTLYTMLGKRPFFAPLPYITQMTGHTISKSDKSDAHQIYESQSNEEKAEGILMLIERGISKVPFRILPEQVEQQLATAMI